MHLVLHDGKVKNPSPDQIAHLVERMSRDNNGFAILSKSDTRFI